MFLGGWVPDAEERLALRLAAGDYGDYEEDSDEEENRILISSEESDEGRAPPYTYTKNRRFSGKPCKS